VLADPDYTTASRIAESINTAFGTGTARARDAAGVEILVPEAEGGSDSVSFLMRVENLTVEPDQRARVVINERTGMVVSGGDVRLSPVTISHGELKVSITTDYLVSQPRVPLLYGGAGAGALVPGGRSLIVPETNIDVEESDARSVSMRANSTVADLVRALETIRTSPREMISILQGMKTAGALHAELIIQ
jgi:flagellar P-ring protein precursor FlgI